MYARSTTVHADPAAVEAGIIHVRDEVQPALEQMSGCVGVSMLADRDSGRCIITSAWADETSMHATEQSVRELRRRTADVMHGRWEAQTWEIAVLHRAHAGHDGACTRVVWGDTEPAKRQEALETFRVAGLPRMAELPGFCSVSMLVHRGTGRSVVATTYDSRDDMRRAAERARAMWEEFNRQMGIRVTDTTEFDLVIHHLRVPETV
jgi:heme-degrading monooxygenase HmoA